MSGLNCQPIVCILRTLLSKARIHLDSYVWALDKPTASLSAMQPSELLLGWQSC